MGVDSQMPTGYKEDIGAASLFAASGLCDDPIDDPSMGGHHATRSGKPSNEIPRVHPEIDEGQAAFRAPA